VFIAHLSEQERISLLMIREWDNQSYNKVMQLLIIILEDPLPMTDMTYIVKVMILSDFQKILAVAC